MVWAHVHKAAELREPELPMQVVLNVLRDTSEPALGQALGGLIGNERPRAPAPARPARSQDAPPPSPAPGRRPPPMRDQRRGPPVPGARPELARNRPGHLAPQ